MSRAQIEGQQTVSAGSHINRPAWEEELARRIKNGPCVDLKLANGGIATYPARYITRIDPRPVPYSDSGEVRSVVYIALKRDDPGMIGVFVNETPEEVAELIAFAERTAPRR